MSKQKYKAYGAFRPDGASMTLFCHSLFDMAYASGNLGQVINGKMQSPKVIEFESLMGRTTVEHELRHYQDFLISTTYMEAFRRKLQLAANSSSLFLTLKINTKITHYVFPFTKWFLLDKKAKNSHISSLSHFYGISSEKILCCPSYEEFELDTEVTDSIDGLWKLTLRDAISIERMLSGLVPASEMIFTPAEVYEVGAITAQFRAMEVLVGRERAFSYYISEIYNSHYGRLTKELLGILGGKGDPLVSDHWLDFLSAISFWTIASGPPPDGRHMMESCPAYRLGRLLSALQRDDSGLHERLSNPNQLIKHFDALCEDTETFERLEKSTEWFQLKVESWIELQQKSTVASPIFNTVIKYFSYILDQRRKLVSAIKRDPEQYINCSMQKSLPECLEFPLLVMDCINVRPTDSEIEAANRAGFGSLCEWAGEGQIIWHSDELEEIRKDLEPLLAIDGLVSKLFFDEKTKFSDFGQETFGQAEKTMIGKTSIRYVDSKKLTASSVLDEYRAD